MKQLVTPNLKQQALAGNCAEFVFLALGGQNGWGFQWARQAWDGQDPDYKFPGKLPPAGFYSLIWFDHWGTYRGIYRNWGHVCFLMPDGRILSSPYQSGRYGQSILSSISEVERLYNSTYLGWTAALDGTLMLDIRESKKTPPIQSKRKRNGTMLGMMINDGLGRYGDRGVVYYATRDSEAKTITYLSNDTTAKRPGDANQVSVNMNASFANLTYPAWEAYHIGVDTFIDATVDPPVRLSGPKGKAGTKVIG